jgi:tRNA-dihydrouridine synthase B
MKTCKEDSPLGIQVTGNDPEEFRKLIPYVNKYDLVDINCGCPSIKIVGNEAGSYLLKNPAKISEMIKILKRENITVTAKMRLGFNKNNALKIAKEIEKAGADALTLHARLAIHGNNIKADWNWIKKIKENVGIPVIGNGDIFKGEDAAKMLDLTDGAMIARAAIGDPLIFQRILYYLRTGKEKEPDFNKNIKLFEQYLKLAEKYNLIDLPRIKYLGSQFIRGFKGASQFRMRLMSFTDIDDIKKFITQLKKTSGEMLITSYTQAN